MTPEREDRLFPGDAFLYETNPLSIGFGAVGIAYSILKSGFDVPSVIYNWIKEKLSEVNKDKYPPGLITGMAGISWGLWELNMEEAAIEIAKRMNSHPLKMEHHSYYYGMAGIGLANLFFYHKTKQQEFLDEAYIIGEKLLEKVQTHMNGFYWNLDGNIYIGLAYGQSGVALFLLRLYNVTHEKKFFNAGLLALSYDFSKKEFIEKNVISFKDNTGTFEPHVEVGSGGIAKVALRYGFRDQELEYLANNVHYKYAVFPSISFGLAGFIDTLIDFYIFTKNFKYLEMAKLPLEGLKELYLIRTQGGIAVPGDSLLRFSNDYLTGAAGVLRTLKRLINLDDADFMLDELSGEELT